MIINKRLGRGLKKDFGMYTVVFLIVMIGIAVISAFIVSADTVTYMVEHAWEETNVEDGSFDTAMAITQEQQDALENVIQVEDKSYIDVSQGERTYRMSQVRTYMNQIELVEGTLPSHDDEVVIDNQYAKMNQVNLQDEILIMEKVYTVVGLGFTSDYTQLLKKTSDLYADDQFALVYVTDMQMNELVETRDSLGDMVYSYAYQYKENSNKDDLEDALSDLYVVSWIEAHENPRVNGAIDDVAMNRSIALIEGVLLSVLIAFVLSVFSMNQMRRDSVIIGTLSALGYERRKLVNHFECLPCIIVLVASIVGVLLGIGMSPVMVASTEYSYGEYKVYCNIVVVAYLVILPATITYLINGIALLKALSKCPIRLLKKERKMPPTREYKIKNMSFTKMFQIRQIQKELKICAVMFVGIMLSVLILLLGLSIPSSIDHYTQLIEAEVASDYVYTLYAPLIEEQEKSQIGYIKNLTLEEASNFDITFMGIDESNDFFAFTQEVKRENGIYISDSVSRKFGYQIGETLTVQDGTVQYDFIIDGIVPYSNGLYVFMNIEEMCRSFEQEAEYYNIIFSNEELDIADESVYSITHKSDIMKMAVGWKDSVGVISTIMIAASIIIFVAIVFLLMKVIIERSENNISLVKIFGFHRTEIAKMYLGSGFYVVCASILIGLPINMVLIQQIFPLLFFDVNVGIACHMDAYLYVVSVGIIVLAYCLSRSILMRKLSKISYVELLKNRD